jgi:hypothetical protein
MGRTKDLVIDLLNEDWEREWQKDFVYLLEEQKRAEQEELYGRQPAEIVVVDKRKIKKKNEPEPTYLPF